MEAFRMVRMAYGGLVAQAVYVAAKLGVADQLRQGPVGAEDLARRTGAHAPSLYRLLRALAALGVFEQREDGTFSLTPLGATLCSDGPESVRDAVIMAGDPMFHRASGELVHTVRTGEPAFEHVFGASFFEHLGKDPETGAVFNRGMANFSQTENAAIAASYDFSPFGTVVDIGGGRGDFLAEVLKIHAGVRGVLYDLPEVIRDATFLDGAELRERSARVAGSFFESVPPGADAYVLKRVLHDWDDETCLGILRRCRQGMPAGGRILVVDAVVPPGGEPDPSKMADLVILVLLHGKERTEAEFRALLATASLRLERVVPTPSALSIIEAAAA